MSCEGHRPSIRALALGEAVPPGLEPHLGACPSCRALLEDDRRLLGRIENGIEALLSVEASPPFVARVRGRLGESERGVFTWAHRWALPAALSAVGLLVIASLSWRALSRPTSLPGTITPVPPVAAESQWTGVLGAPLPGSDPAPAPAPGSLPEAREATPPVAIRAGQAEAALPASPMSTTALRSWSAAPRIAPDVLIPAGEGEAVRSFVAGRSSWRLVDESLHPGESQAPEARSAVDWELGPSERSTVFSRELDAWPLAPGD